MIGDAAGAPSPKDGYGPHYLTDYEAFREQLAVRTGAANVSGLYRWFWMPPMPTWQYDERQDFELISSDVRFSWL